MIRRTHLMKDYPLPPTADFIFLPDFDKMIRFGRVRRPVHHGTFRFDRS